MASVSCSVLFRAVVLTVVVRVYKFLKVPTGVVRQSNVRATVDTYLCVLDLGLVAKCDEVRR